MLQKSFHNQSLVDEEREVIEASAETLRCATIDITPAKLVGDDKYRKC